MSLAYNRSLYFRLYPLRFSVVAKESLYFPPGKSANILRGAFGTIFRRLACVTHCPGARMCDLRTSCPYALMFEPSTLADGPSGLADWPRPFVFRASHLDGSTVEAGAGFSFDLNLFDMRNPAIPYLVLAFTQFVREGLGPKRGRADLVSVWQLNRTGEPATQVFDGGTLLRDVEAMELDLKPAGPPVYGVHLRFVTPTELKGGHQVMDQPEFAVLMRRIRDRVSTLRSLYDGGPLELDFRGFGERAERVRMTHCNIHRVETMRESTRTGQAHSIGGFVGESEYEGELAEFMPYLRAAKWTGVGRRFWGRGKSPWRPNAANRQPVRRYRPRDCRP